MDICEIQSSVATFVDNHCHGNSEIPPQGRQYYDTLKRLGKAAQAMEKISSQGKIMNEKECVTFLVEVKRLFQDKQFYLESERILRIEFYMEITRIALAFLKDLIGKNPESVNQLSKDAKYPCVISCFVFSCLLEMNEVDPNHFFEQIDKCFEGLEDPQKALGSIVYLVYLVKEMDLKDGTEDLEQDRLIQNNGKQIKEIDEELNDEEVEQGEQNKKKVELSAKTQKIFFQQYGMKLLAPSMYIMSKVSMDPIPEIISVLLSPALKLFTGILSVFSTADDVISLQEHINQRQVINGFLKAIQSNRGQQKNDFLDLTKDTLEFISKMAVSEFSLELYRDSEKFFIFLLEHFSPNNSQIDYFEFNQLCFSFLFRMKRILLNQEFDLGSYPVLMTFFSRATNISLLTFENQLISLRICTHIYDYILRPQQLKQSENLSMKISEQTYTALAEIFNNGIINNIKFIFQKRSSNAEEIDEETFIELLVDICTSSMNLIPASQTINTNYSYKDQPITIIFLLFFIFFQSYEALLSQTRILGTQIPSKKYFSLWKHLTKKYFQYLDEIYQISSFTISTKQQMFELSRFFFEGFQECLQILQVQDLQFISFIEQKLSFFREIGSKLFNVRRDLLIRTEILDMFQQKIDHPQNVVIKILHSKLPESFLSMSSEEFRQACYVLGSIRYFAFFQHQNPQDYMFERKGDARVVSQILQKTSALQQIYNVKNYWIDSKNKQSVETLKLFYKNAIYWLLVESEGRDTDENIFKSLFSSQESFIFLMKSILKSFSENILPDQLLRFINIYVSGMTKQPLQFQTESDTFNLCKFPRFFRFHINNSHLFLYFSAILEFESSYRRQFQKLILLIAKNVPYKLPLEFSHIDFAIQQYVQDSTVFLKQRILTKMQQLQQPLNDSIRTFDASFLIEDSLSILIYIAETLKARSLIVEDQQPHSLSRTLFMNRVFFTLVSCISLRLECLVTHDFRKIALVNMKQLQFSEAENHVFCSILAFLKIALTWKLNFLQKEELSGECTTFFSFILQLFAGQTPQNRQPDVNSLSMQLVECVLGFFGQEDITNPISILAKKSPDFQQFALMNFQLIWKRILDVSAEENQSSKGVVREKEQAQITSFILKFALCIDEDFTFFNSQILLAIQSHAFFKYRSQEAYNFVQEAFTFKKINEKERLQSFFLRNLMKNLIALSKTINIDF